MGYYTDFNLEIRTPMTKERAKQITIRLNELVGWGAFELDISGFTFMDEKREFWKIDVFDEKWYDWEENMTAFVKEFPDVQFYLEGNGENKDDWWVALFKGDKKQVKYCSPPIDEWED